MNGYLAVMVGNGLLGRRFIIHFDGISVSFVHPC